MKKLIVLIILYFLMLQLIAQTTTGRIENLKDAWGTSFDYIGEIKNKQPNGVGIAIYSNDFALRYSGYFVNGQYNGKGVLLFKDSTFLSGDWQNGKLNGKGANLTKNGDLYIGNFEAGKKQGYGTFIYADNGLLTGRMANDTYEGRCIYIPADGTSLNDNIYVDGKKTGSGYQYDLSSKTLFEGSWNKGDWVSNGTASYYSFLKTSSFYAEKTDDQILMGGINKGNENKLQDTAFFYDIKNHNRYFGYCDKGFLADGIIIKDSTRFIGKVNDDGAYGQCSYYKMKSFYDEGNYEKDYLTGNKNLSINLKAKTVYYGETADKGLFSGDAWFSNKYNELYKGNYIEGKFTGTGYIVFSNGKTVKGTFADGKTIAVISITDENGMPLNIKPKTIAEALNLITNEYSNNYETFKGGDVINEDYSLDDYYDSYNSIITFPGSIETDVIAEDYDFYLSYYAVMYKGNNFTDARLKYDDLCKSISAASLHLKNKTEVVTLSGNIESAKESNTARTKFKLQNYSSLSDYNVYAELKYDGGQYKVSLIAGDLKFGD